MRGRKNYEVEAQREQVEGQMALLGNARVYLRMVSERMKVAAHYGLADVLIPALEDAQRAEELIVKVQQAMQEV